MGLITNIAVEYNHIFPFLAALGLFMTFLSVNVSNRVSKAINRIAPYTLGVYLLHENLGVRYVWENWLGADRVTSIAGLLLSVLTATVIVFAAGILVDILRTAVMSGLHRILLKIPPYKRITDRIKSADLIFKITD